MYTARVEKEGSGIAMNVALCQLTIAQCVQMRKISICGHKSKRCSASVMQHTSAVPST